MGRGETRASERPPVPAAGAAGRLPHPFTLTWRDGLFVHWPVDPDALVDRIPDSLTLDTRDGTAWVGVLAFVCTNAGLRGSPHLTRLAFPELNVRTYVRYEGDPGLYFLSVDVDSLAIAGTVGRLSRLPVHRARMHVDRTDDRVSFASSRESATGPPARFAASYRPIGEIRYPEPGTLAAWLTERRRLYAPHDGGVLTAEVAHAPWPLQNAHATLHENTLLAANGLPAPADGPVAHFCSELVMTASIPRRLRDR